MRVSFELTSHEIALVVAYQRLFDSHAPTGAFVHAAVEPMLQKWFTEIGAELERAGFPSSARQAARGKRPWCKSLRGDKQPGGR